jgi:iron(III) transport system permease protein
LYVAASVGVIGTVPCYVMAFVLTRTNVPLKRPLHLLMMLPIISPPFVGAVSILFLFGFNGLVTKQLLQLQDFNIYGRGGVVFSQIFTFAPLAYLSLRGVLQSISPTLEDAAFNIGASKWQAFWRVTLPLSLPGVFSAFLVVFIESISDFGNPLVLAGAGFPMLAPQAYLEITGSFNLGRGAMLATILLLPSLMAFAIQRYWVSKRQYVTVTGKPTASTTKLVSPAAKWSLYVVVVAFAALVAAFYAVIVIGAFTRVWGFDYTLTLQHLRYVFSVGLDAVADRTDRRVVCRRGDVLVTEFDGRHVRRRPPLLEGVRPRALVEECLELLATVVGVADDLGVVVLVGIDHVLQFGDRRRLDGEAHVCAVRGPPV